MYPFFVLGVDHDATDEQVAARYRELVRAYPPDRAPEQFAEIRQAFEALADRRRRLYTRLYYMDEHDPQRQGGLHRGPPPRVSPAERSRLTEEELAALLREAPLCQRAGSAGAGLSAPQPRRHRGDLQQEEDGAAPEQPERDRGRATGGKGAGKGGKGAGKGGRGAGKGGKGAGKGGKGAGRGGKGAGRGGKGAGRGGKGKAGGAPRDNKGRSP
jgi:curved DNA-binding protein CbpA